MMFLGKQIKRYFIKVKKIFNFNFLYLVIGALASLSPVICNYYYSGASLSLQYLGSFTLVKNETGLNDLRIFYADKQVDSITRSNFQLVNNGYEPLLESDIIKAITITYNDSTEILDAGFDKSIPNDISCNLMIDSTKRHLKIYFKLLNEDDTLIFHTLVNGDNTFRVSARIKGIKKIKIEDREAEFKKLGNDRKNIPLYQLILGLLLCMYIIFFPSAMNKNCLEFEKKYLNDIEKFPKYNSIKEYINFIKTETTFLEPTKRKNVYYFIDAHEQCDDLHIELIKFLSKTIHDSKKVFKIEIMLGVVGFVSIIIFMLYRYLI